MSWNLTKSALLLDSPFQLFADFPVEFKETHLGPLKNPLGRSTSTSTIKPDTPEPIIEKEKPISTTSTSSITNVPSGSTGDVTIGMFGRLGHGLITYHC